MKQVQVDTGGRPFNNDDLLTLQQELTDATQAQFLGKGPFVLAGCQVSGTGAAVNVAAGIVCLDGQLLRFAGAGAVTLPMQFQAGAAVGSDPRPYQTGGTKSCMREVPAVLVAADPAYTLGEFLPLATWGAKRWNDVVRASVRTPSETQTLGTRGYDPSHYDATGLGLPGIEAWGWALANGQNDTDDLQARTTAGMSSFASEYFAGVAGGATSVALTLANLPANPAGTPNVATFTSNGSGNLTPSGSNGWAGAPPQAGIGQALDTRSPYMALPVRQWVGY